MCVKPAVVDLIREFSSGADIKLALHEKGKFRKHKDIVLELKRSKFLIEKDLQERTLFKEYNEERIKSYVLDGRHIRNLRFEMASYCNFRCRHCFAPKIYSWDKNRKMDFITARLAIDGFVRILKKNNIKSAVITYWGGEPLLNWSTIVKIVEYTDKIIRGLSIEISHAIITNASLLNDSILDFIRKFKMSIRVSLDGLEQENDRFRIFLNGRGTFKSIIRGLDGLSKYRIPFSVEIMLNSYSFYSLEKVIDFLQEKYKCSDFVVSPIFFQKGSPDFDCQTVEEKVERLIKLYDYSVRKGFSLGMPTLGPVKAAFQRKPDPLFNCLGLYNTLYIKPSGSVYPCQKLDNRIGNVRRMEEVFHNENYRHVAMRSVDKIRGCYGCDIEGFCKGGCAGIIKFYSGDIYDTSHSLVRKYYCKIMQLFFKEMLKYKANYQAQGVSS
jgi:uncharacterized protein